MHGLLCSLCFAGASITRVSIQPLLSEVALCCFLLHASCFMHLCSPSPLKVFLQCFLLNPCENIYIGLYIGSHIYRVCTTLLYPAHSCISYHLHTQPTLIYRVSLAMSCHVYPDIMLGVYSKATTCVRQTMCTADRAIPSIITTISTALPTCHLRCMSTKLICLIYRVMHI
jgi:hypothetical protein